MLASQILCLRAGVVFIVGIPLWQQLRRAIVEPRTGYLRLGISRLRTLRKAKWTLMALVASTGLALLFLAAYPEALTDYRGTLLGMTVALPVGVAGHILDVRRLYVFGGGLAVTAVVLAQLGYAPSIAFFVTGIAIAATGIAYLSSFLREHHV